MSFTGAEGDKDRLAEKALTHLAAGQHVIISLHAPFIRGEDRQIAAMLGQTALAVCANHALGGMIMTGGDTAIAVCQLLGAQAIHILHEVEPGVPAGYPQRRARRWLAGCYQGWRLWQPRCLYQGNTSIRKSVGQASVCPSKLEELVPHRPILGVTMGDPAGTGAEITAKCWAQLGQELRMVVIGDAAAMREALRITETPGVVRAIASIAEARFAADTLDVLDLQNIDLASLQRGKVSAMAGKAAYEYIARAVELATRLEIDAIVTSALHKEALNLAGHHYAGHTEILADLTHTPRVTMMLVGANLRVSHVSTHCSLRQAIERCKTPRILEVIRLTHQALLQMDVAAPRMAVAGLNPHCGEGGLFGDEDRLEIAPAIEAARAEGMNVYPAPLAPDTVFYRMKEGQFDAVVAQYHDQGPHPAQAVGL